MSPFFSDPNALASLEMVAEGWLGTPFQVHGRIPGRAGGCSCETLPYCIYHAVGFLRADWPMPEGPIDWYRAQKISIMEPFLDSRPEFHRLPLTECTPGDLLGFRVGKVIHHLGVLLTHSHFIHCLAPRGVQLGNVRDATYRKRLAAVWRPVV